MKGTFCPGAYCCSGTFRVMRDYPALRKLKFFSVPLSPFADAGVYASPPPLQLPCEFTSNNTLDTYPSAHLYIFYPSRFIYQFTTFFPTFHIIVSQMASKDPRVCCYFLHKYCTVRPIVDDPYFGNPILIPGRALLRDPVTRSASAPLSCWMWQTLLPSPVCALVSAGLNTRHVLHLSPRLAAGREIDRFSFSVFAAASRPRPVLPPPPRNQLASAPLQPFFGWGGLLEGAGGRYKNIHQHFYCRKKTIPPSKSGWFAASAYLYQVRIKS
jgi:hypothetical protein